MKKVREIMFYKTCFEEFFNQQTEKVKNKIDEVLFTITIIDRVPKKFFTAFGRNQRSLRS